MPVRHGLLMAVRRPAHRWARALRAGPRHSKAVLILAQTHRVVPMRFVVTLIRNLVVAVLVLLVNLSRLLG
ncbi:MAG: hypothetical protein ACOCVR_04510, partial [Myxococcota bacterium]